MEARDGAEDQGYKGAPGNWYRLVVINKLLTLTSDELQLLFKIQMMKLTDNQLEMTTKRTIMENEQMSIELSYQSRQTEKLLTRNNVLIEENRCGEGQVEVVVSGEIATILNRT